MVRHAPLKDAFETEYDAPRRVCLSFLGVTVVSNGTHSDIA